MVVIKGFDEELKTLYICCTGLCHKSAYALKFKNRQKRCFNSFLTVFCCDQGIKKGQIFTPTLPNISPKRTYGTAPSYYGDEE